MTHSAHFKYEPNFYNNDRAIPAKYEIGAKLAYAIIMCNKITKLLNDLDGFKLNAY